MKIIFNELGVITSTITDDEVYRQGNVGNIIEAVFEDKDSNDYIASFAYTRSDGSTLGQMPMSISGDNSYKFTFNDSWFMELDGITTLTIYLHDSKGNVVANGQVQFNIEKTDYNEITNVTPDELNAWIQALAEIKSYVDVVAEYSTYDNFPTTGETGKIYVDLSTNDIYRWSGSQYIALNSRSVEELEKVIPTDIVAEDNSLKLYHDSTEITGQTSPVTFKTINGSSIIGSGDIEIEGGAGGFVYEMDYAETGTIPLDIVEKLKDANSTIVKRLSFGEGQYFWFYFKLNMSGSDSSTSVLLYQCVTPFLGVNLVSMQIDISTGEFGLVSDSISYDDEPIKLRIDTLETEVNNINNEKGGWYTYSIALTSTTGTLTSSQLTTIKNYPAQTIIYYADHAHRLVKETDTQLIFASVNDYIEYWEITITKSGGGYIVSEIALAQNNAFLEVATQVEELENHKPYIIELSSDSGKLTEEQITRIQEYPYDTYFHFSGNYYYYSSQLSTGSTYYFSALMLGQNVSYLVITIASKSYQRILTQLATSASLSTVTSRVSTLETTIKTKADTDDIPDVSEFITKSVSDLVNYYTKTQVDSQVSSLEAKISAIPKFAISVVTSLPTSGISETTIYLLKSSETETQNLYTEYIYINNAWEKLGTQKIDLTGYATETWVNNQISDFLTSTQINSLLSSYAKTSSLSTIATSGKLSDATTDSTHRVVTDTEKTTWNSKQDKLTFDTTPTSGSTNPVTSGGLYTKFDTYDSKISTLQNSDTFIYEFTYTGSSVTVDSTTLDKIRAKPQNAYIRAILKDNTYLLFHFVGYVSETNEVMVFSCFENETSYSATINNGTLSIATISLASNTQVNNLGAEVENLLDETPYSITISMGGGTIASTDLAHLIEHPYSTYLVETNSKNVFHIEVNTIESTNSCLFVNYSGSSIAIRVAIDTTTGGYTVNKERLALYSELSGTGVTYNLALTAQTGTLTSSQVTSLKNKHATITYNDSVYRFYELNSTYLIYSRDIITNTASYISIKLSDNSYAVANTTLATEGGSYVNEEYVKEQISDIVTDNLVFKSDLVEVNEAGTEEFLWNNYSISNNIVGGETYTIKVDDLTKGTYCYPVIYVRAENINGEIIQTVLQANFSTTYQEYSFTLPENTAQIKLQFGIYNTLIDETTRNVKFHNVILVKGTDTRLSKVLNEDIVLKSIEPIETTFIQDTTIFNNDIQIYCETTAANKLYSFPAEEGETYTIEIEGYETNSSYWELYGIYTNQYGDLPESENKIAFNVYGSFPQKMTLVIPENISRFGIQVYIEGAQSSIILKNVKIYKGSIGNTILNNDIKIVDDSYKDYGLPVLYLAGTTYNMSKENKVTLNYVYGDLNGTCTCKWQGGSSLFYPKKNYTIVFDTEFEAKDGWGNHNKYVMKANYIDFSHARNLVTAELWGVMVKERENAPTELSSLINGGAVDGFPICLVINGAYEGLYTFNIPKDAWLFGMGNGTQEAIISAEGVSTASGFVSAPTLGTDFDVEYVTDENNTEWIQTALTNIYNAVQNATTATEFEKNVGALVDIDSIIDYIILCGLTQNYDGIIKNYLLATFNGTKWYISAYDMDSTYGIQWTGDSFIENYLISSTIGANVLLTKAWTLLRDKVVSRYKTLRSFRLSNRQVFYRFNNFGAKIPKRILDEEVKLWTLIPSTSVNNINQIVTWYMINGDLIDEEISWY